MADAPSDPDSSGDAGAGPSPRPMPSTPRWVKVFGIVALVVVVLVVVVMLIGGGDHGPGRHAMSGDPGSQTSPSSGVVPVAGAGGLAHANEADRTVEVDALDSMAFEPGGIHVAAGETVTFVVTNSGHTVHEFTLGDAAMQQEHAAAMAHMTHGMAHDLPNSISLAPGETKQLTWRFGHTGTLEYACHEPGHYPAGMRGHITVS